MRRLYPYLVSSRDQAVILKPILGHGWRIGATTSRMPKSRAAFVAPKEVTRISEAAERRTALRAPFENHGCVETICCIFRPSGRRLLRASRVRQDDLEGEKALETMDFGRMGGASWPQTSVTAPLPKYDGRYRMECCILV